VRVPVVWPKLETLNLSFNHIPISSLSYLGHLGIGGTGGILKELDLSGNLLTHLPEDLSFLRSLETLNLSHNTLSSTSAVFNPTKYFISFASLPRLKRLDLSYNQLAALHVDELLLKTHSYSIFKTLVELDISFNQIRRQEDLRQAVHFKALNLLNIVGNPLVIEACTRGVSTATS